MPAGPPSPYRGILAGYYSDPTYDITDDYPRADVEDYQQDVEKQVRKPAIVTRATYLLEKEDLRGLEEELGTGLFNVSSNRRELYMHTLFTTVLTIVALSISGCVTIDPTPHDEAAHAAAIASQEVKIEEYITGSFDWRCHLVVNKGKILRLLEPKLVTISVTSTGRCNMTIVVDDEGPTLNTMKFIPAGTSTALVKWPVTKHIVLERSHTPGGFSDNKAKGSYIIKVYPMPTTPTQ